MKLPTDVLTATRGTVIHPSHALRLSLLATTVLDLPFKIEETRRSCVDQYQDVLIGVHFYSDLNARILLSPLTRAFISQARNWTPARPSQGARAPPQKMPGRAGCLTGTPGERPAQGGRGPSSLAGLASAASQLVRPLLRV